jgi:hypothetical protein
MTIIPRASGDTIAATADPVFINAEFVPACHRRDRADASTKPGDCSAPQFISKAFRRIFLGVWSPLALAGCGTYTVGH